MSLRIEFFGEFSILRNGGRISNRVWDSQFTKTLLKILASSPYRPFKKDELIEYLWPDSDKGPKKLADNLRNRIKELKKILEPGRKAGKKSRYITLTADRSYVFNQENDCQIDIFEFKEFCEKSERFRDSKDWDSAVDCGEKAIKLYKTGFSPEDRYFDWPHFSLAYFENLYLEVLEILIRNYTSTGKYTRAIALCEKAIKIQPDREATYAHLMKCFCFMGHPLRAHQTFQRYESKMSTLGVRPSLAMEKLDKEIIEGKLADANDKIRPVPIDADSIAFPIGPPPLVGRRREISRLFRCWEETLTGQGNSVIISAETGGGKTYLIENFVSHPTVKESHPFILWGTCIKLEVPTPFEPILQSLRETSGIPFDYLSQTLSPEQISQLRKLIANSTDQKTTSNEVLTPAQEYRGLSETLLATIETLSKKNPVILVMEDLQWADHATHDLLERGLRRFGRQRILTVCSYCNEGDIQPPFEQKRTRNGRDLFQTLSLSRLSLSNTKKLLKVMGKMRELYADRLSRRLHEETAGNPNFLTTVIYNLVDQGAMEIESDGSWKTAIDDISDDYKELMIPAAIVDVVKNRLVCLTAEENELMKVAAVIGPVIDSNLLEVMWKEKKNLHELLENLICKHLLVDEGPYLVFNHEKIREVIYENIMKLKLCSLHKEAAESIERIYSASIENYYNPLAHHFEKADLLHKSFNYAVLALKKALSLYQSKDALKLAEFGLSLFERLQEQDFPEINSFVSEAFYFLEQQVALNRILGRRDQQKHAVKQFVDWAEAAEDGSKLVQARLFQTLLLIDLREYGRAKEVANDALQLAERIRDVKSQFYALTYLGTVELSINKKEALKYYQKAYSIFEDTAPCKEQVMGVHNLGIIQHGLAQRSEEFGSALAYYEKTLSLAKLIDDRWAEATVTKNIGVFYSNLGNSKALKFYEKALALFHDLGAVQEEATCLIKLAIFEVDLKKYDRALRHYQKAHELFVDLEDRKGECYALIGLGDIQEEAYGDYSRAAAFYEVAQKLASVLDDKTQIGVALQSLGKAYQGQGDYDIALRYYQNAIKIQRENGDSLQMTHTMLTLGKLYSETNDHRKALRILEKGLFNAEGRRTLEIGFLAYKTFSHCQLGESDDALHASETAIKLLDETSRFEQASIVYFARFKALSLIGLTSKANEFLDQAKENVMQLAEGIEDSEMRALFLNLKMNRLILDTQAGRNT